MNQAAAGNNSNQPVNLHDIITQSQIIEAVHDSEVDPSIFISMRGIKFQLKMVSSHIGMELARSIKDPPMPTYTDDEGRTRDNPLDPTYREQLQQAQISRGMLAMNANMALGSEVVYIPDGVEGPNNNNWSNELDQATNGIITVPEGGYARYLAWLRYYALVGNESADLSNAIMRFSGVVLEQDVDLASNSFQGDKERNTSEGISTPEETES